MTELVGGVAGPINYTGWLGLVSPVLLLQPPQLIYKGGLVSSRTSIYAPALDVLLRALLR